MPSGIYERTETIRKSISDSTNKRLKNPEKLKEARKRMAHAAKIYRQRLKKERLAREAAKNLGFNPEMGKVFRQIERGEKLEDEIELKKFPTIKETLKKVAEEKEKGKPKEEKKKRSGWGNKKKREGRRSVVYSLKSTMAEITISQSASCISISLPGLVNITMGNYPNEELSALRDTLKEMGIKGEAFRPVGTYRGKILITSEDFKSRDKVRDVGEQIEKAIRLENEKDELFGKRED